MFVDARAYCHQNYNHVVAGFRDSETGCLFRVSQFGVCNVIYRGLNKLPALFLRGSNYIYS